MNFSLETLADLFQRHKEAYRTELPGFRIGGSPVVFGREPALMGVVNLSHDSWYRESVCLDPEAAIRRSLVLHAQGAHIIDIGAESTLPAADRVGAAQQTARLAPIIRALAERDILVSVETYSAHVARPALEAGARILNITGTDDAPALYQAAAEHDAAVILCYVQGANVREVADFHLDDDPLPAMLEYFQRETERAQSAGVHRIFVDAGLGFYYRNLSDSRTRIRHQLVTFLNGFRLRSLGFPVCNALPHAFEFFQEEVRTAEPFFAVIAALGRTDLFRTHEIPKVRAVLETARTF